MSANATRLFRRSTTARTYAAARDDARYFSDLGAIDTAYQGNGLYCLTSVRYERMTEDFQFVVTSWEDAAQYIEATARALLWDIYDRPGSYTPKQRAAAMADIQDLEAEADRYRAMAQRGYAEFHARWQVWRP